MNEDKLINSLANTLISQYGDDAETVATLRAAEYACLLYTSPSPRDRG